MVGLFNPELHEALGICKPPSFYSFKTKQIFQQGTMDHRVECFRGINRCLHRWSFYVSWSFVIESISAMLTNLMHIAFSLGLRNVKCLLDPKWYFPYFPTCSTSKCVTYWYVGGRTEAEKQSHILASLYKQVKRWTIANMLSSESSSGSAITPPCFFDENKEKLDDGTELQPATIGFSQDLK